VNAANSLNALRSCYERAHVNGTSAAVVVNSKQKPDHGEWTRVRRLEARLSPLCIAARQLLSVACPDNGASERVRLAAALKRGDLPQPQWEPPIPRKVTDGFRLIDSVRRELDGLIGASLYEAKLDELELDLALLDAIGDARRMRPIVRRRFPGGESVVPDKGQLRSLAAIAAELLTVPAESSESRALPAVAPSDQPSLARVITEIAQAAGLDVEVRVEPRLAAGAATGERTVFVADRQFGMHEALRLAVHEVLGHLTVAANGRAQPSRLLEWGTAGSFGDQEGVAIYLEELYGELTPQRLRTLAGRVVATDRVFAEAPFGDTARHLHRDLGFSAEEATAISERAYRGGGLARDASYLLGYLRVRHAIENKLATLDELRAGRLSVDSLAAVREMIASGHARRAVYRPNLSRNLVATISGTTLDTSPPSSAASFTRLELT
jgi:hypothetical protein